jgi:hypothetical protein
MAQLIRTLGGLPEFVTEAESLSSQMSSARIAVKDCLGCFAYVLGPEDDFCLRVNTLHTYLEANREVNLQVT